MQRCLKNETLSIPRSCLTISFQRSLRDALLVNFPGSRGCKFFVAVIHRFSATAAPFRTPLHRVEELVACKVSDLYLRHSTIFLKGPH